MNTEASRGYPTISVIIPCYNRCATILDTLQSVMLQKYPAHEIIVIDDGSTDQTGEIIKSNYTSSQVKYIYQENSGSASARNTGLDNAQGEWVAFLDSDDQWTENKLLDDVKIINSSTDIDFIHGNRVQKHPGGKTDKGRLRKPISDFQSKQYLLAAWCMKTSTVLIKRDLLDSLDHYFLPTLRTCQDYELFWRAILSAQRIAYVDTPNVLINLTEDGASRTQLSLNLIKDNITAIDSALNWTGQIGAQKTYKSILELRKSHESLNLLRQSLRTKNLQVFISNFWKVKHSILYITFNSFSRRFKFVF